MQAEEDRRVSIAGRHPEVGGDRADQVGLDGRRRRPATSAIANSSSASSALRRVCGRGRRADARPACAGGGRGRRRARSRQILSDVGQQFAGRRGRSGSAERCPGRSADGRLSGRRRRRAGLPGGRCARTGGAGGGSGRRRPDAARREQVGLRAGLVGSVSSASCALGVRLVVGLDALLDLVLRDRGQVVEPGSLVVVHLGQVEPGDLARARPGRRRRGRRRWRRRSTATGCTLQPPHRPPPRMAEQHAPAARCAPDAGGRARRRRGRRRGWPAAAPGAAARRRGAAREARARPGVESSAEVAMPAVAGGRAADDRALLDDVLVGDVGDDHGDVVRAAAAQRELRRAARRTGCGSTYSRRVARSSRR